MLELGLSLNDITLLPAVFSEVRSRKDVNPNVNWFGVERLPVISSNMDSVFSPTLSKEVLKAGGLAVTHRFCSIEENIRLFNEGQFEGLKPWVSVGVGGIELERALALEQVGAEVFVLDLANGASVQAFEQYLNLRKALSLQAKVIVGNFDSKEQIQYFATKARRQGVPVPDAFKCGIGPGSACITRTVTGVGTPSVTSLLSCVESNYPIIWDGGVSEPGDLCKIIALGAKGVFIGRLFAQTLESGAEKITETRSTGKMIEDELPLGFIDSYEETVEVPVSVKYRGSASFDSYTVQNKHDEHRTPEGESMVLPITGTVKELIQKLEAGLRSSMSYLGVFNITQFQQNANWFQVTSQAQVESKAHGKKN